MLTIHGVPISVHTRKVIVAAHEKRLPFRNEPVIPFQPPAGWAELSPTGKIPVVTDGDLILRDSSVICAYLERTHPTHPLYPTEARAYAEALWFEEYADSQVASTLVRSLFFERVVKKMLRMQPDESICEAALRDHMPAIGAYLEKEIGDRDYLVVNAFSIADIAVGSMFVNVRHAGEAVDAGRWPKLAAYVARLHARPSFKALIEEETPFVTRFRDAA